MAEIDRWLAGINQNLALPDVVEPTVWQRRFPPATREA
jgi:hypothetical protein